MQIKTKLRYQYLVTFWYKMKKTENNKCVEVYRVTGTCYMLDLEYKSTKPPWSTASEWLLMLSKHISCGPAVALIGVQPPTQNACTHAQKDMHKHAHSNIVCNSSKLETAQMSSNSRMN